MCADRVEGSVWHPLSDGVETADVNESRGAMHFTQLMSPVPAGINSLTTKSMANKSVVIHSRNQRYRLVGGYAEGVVCEVGERDGVVYIKILIPDYALFTSLAQLSPWLSARLRESGHALVLDMAYIGHGLPAQHAANEEKAKYGKPIQDEKHSPRGMPFGETPSS